MHVPALREPLYSLRKHKSMPGCGTFSFYNVGSYILFPNFALRIDDSDDNMVSYRSIGRSPIQQLDYAEPRANRSTTNSPNIPLATPTAIPTSDPHVIPSDESISPADPTSIPSSQPTDESDAVTVDTVPDEPPLPTNDTPISESDLIANTSQPLSKRSISKLHHDPANLPDVRPANTPAPCENRTDFDSLKLHRIFGCRRFRNYKHLAAASSNAKLIHTGELPPTLGSHATITNPPAGKSIKKHRRYLDKVHMDIIYGDCVALGGYRYGLLLVDVATRYCWIFGMTSLTGAEVVTALESFRAEAEGVPRKFHADFDKKLIGGKALRGSKLTKAKLSPPQPAANLPTASLNAHGAPSSKWPVRTSQRNK